MNGGATFLAAAAAVAIAGCSTEGKLEVRAAGSQTAATDAPVPQRLGQAHAQLSLGNAGLALELFRKALREDPASAEANSGIALSYDSMNRFDLSRRYHEAALAIAPADTRILERLAASLHRQGKRDDAAEVRREIAVRLAAATPPAVAEPMPELPLERGATATKEAPPAVATAAAVVQPATALPKVATASVSVTLPPARPATSAAAIPTVPAVPAPPREAALAQPPSAERPLPQIAAGPRAKVGPEPRASARLERMSPAEVTLVTSRATRWRSHVVAQNKHSTTIRYVPLRSSRTAIAGVRLLNAARSHGLAARTRDYLAAKGWRRLAIGDAPEARDTSIIYYPENRRRTAEVLAAQFRIRIARRAGGGNAIVVLLGRDAARVKAGRAPV